MVYAKGFTSIKTGLKLSLRVYTGIVANDSRGCGKDAIRVTLFAKVGEKIVKAGGSKRVHRVDGWKANLQNRINNWQDNLRICPRCGMPMALRTGRNGKFIGCTNYPNCCYTINKAA